jgi:hypothetical protein
MLLGRSSNLPTVFSNCLAGWILGGGGDNWSRFALLTFGASLLYIGGMFLNDAFDAEFDTQHRRERPIPRGAVAERTVWQVGFGLLAAGLALVSALGVSTALLGLVLTASILLYNAVHKMVAFSPTLMATCRLLLYLLAASTGAKGVTGLAVWSAVGLAFYVVGLSYIARKEATGVVIQRWPQLLLCVPALLAVMVNDGSSRTAAMLFIAIAGLWAFRSLRSVWFPPYNVPRAVSGLLAGIVWIDLLAVADQPKTVAIVFIALFLLAIGFQRFVPAT